MPARMGSGLGPSPGLCAGETPQETGLAKWPPFPFSSLGHDCAVSLPEEAQGGRLPFGASSAPGWCPQTLRSQGWAGARWDSGRPVYMCVYRGWGTEQDICSPVSQWWAPPDLGTGILPVSGVLISIILLVSSWFLMTM